MYLNDPSVITGYVYCSHILGLFDIPELHHFPIGTNGNIWDCVIIQIFVAIQRSSKIMQLRIQFGAKNSLKKKKKHHHSCITHHTITVCTMFFLSTPVRNLYSTSSSPHCRYRWLLFLRLLVVLRLQHHCNRRGPSQEWQRWPCQSVHSHLGVDHWGIPAHSEYPLDHMKKNLLYCHFTFCYNEICLLH